MEREKRIGNKVWITRDYRIENRLRWKKEKKIENRIWIT
jgi:hypothetical protein